MISTRFKIIRERLLQLDKLLLQIEAMRTTIENPKARTYDGISVQVSPTNITEETIVDIALLEEQSQELFAEVGQEAYEATRHIIQLQRLGIITEEEAWTFEEYVLGAKPLSDVLRNHNSIPAFEPCGFKKLKNMIRTVNDVCKR